MTVPVSKQDRQLHKIHSEGLVRISTDEDIMGYGYCYPAKVQGKHRRFGLPPFEVPEKQIKPRLKGRDPSKYPFSWNKVGFSIAR